MENFYSTTSDEVIKEHYYHILEKMIENDAEIYAVRKENILSNDTEILNYAKSEMKNVFVDKAEDLFNNLGQDKINQLFKLDGEYHY